MRKNTVPKKIQYIRDIFAHEDENLANVALSLSTQERGMQIGADEGKILYTLVRMIKARKIIELGVLNGYSSIWIARALPDNGILYSLEKDTQRIKICENNFRSCGVSDKIELISGPALDSLSMLENKGPFDMIFIDADKGNYCKYLDWAEKNIKSGGLIVADNTFLFGAVCDDADKEVKPAMIKIMQEFNLRLSDPQKYSAIMIPTHEGLTVAVKEF